MRFPPWPLIVSHAAVIKVLIFGSIGYIGFRGGSICTLVHVASMGLGLIFVGTVLEVHDDEGNLGVYEWLCQGERMEENV